jgi:hypothetical protein
MKVIVSEEPHTREYSSLIQLRIKKSIDRKKKQSESNVRIPRIQSREPLAFHFLKASPWINHVPVPLDWELCAISWFIEKLGAAIQFRRISRD